jgi:hypothetical protein
MPKAVIQNSRPFFMANRASPQNAEGRKMLGFHRHRYPTKTLPAHEIQAASDSAGRIKKIG